MAETLVEIRDLVKEFPVRGGILQRQVATVRAVAGVSIDIFKGETLGLVGESGCGKTTLGRMLTRLMEPTSGTIQFDGEDITHLSGNDLKPFRRRVQIIFQDPYGSLDPRSQVGPAIAEGLRLHGIGTKDEQQERVKEMLELVGLRASHASRYPHEFSGGQRQRIGIARALILKPDLVVADEPVSALDVSVQAQVLNLLTELQEELAPHPSLRRPQSRCCRAHLRSRCGHVPRPGGGVDRSGHPVPKPAPPLYRGSSLRDPDRRPRPASEPQDPARRDPFAAQPTPRMPFPPPLSRSPDNPSAMSRIPC